MGLYDDVTYVIVPFVEVTQEMIDVCSETSFDTLRHSTQGVDRVVLKWIGPTPPAIIGYTEYTYSEILVEMEKPEWNNIDNSSSSSE